MNLTMLNEAVRLVRKHKGVDLYIEEATVEQNRNAAAFNRGFSSMHVHIPEDPTINIHVRAHKKTNDYTEDYNIELILFMRDLTDGSEVDKVIGNISSLDRETRETMRLAYILYSGYRYAVDHIMHKDFHPRVVSIKQNYF